MNLSGVMVGFVPGAVSTGSEARVSFVPGGVATGSEAIVGVMKELYSQALACGGSQIRGVEQVSWVNGPVKTQLSQVGNHLLTNELRIVSNRDDIEDLQIGRRVRQFRDYERTEMWVE